MPENKYKQDFIEVENDNDGSAKDTVQFWEKKQRELVTSVVDYNLKSLTELVTSRQIDLSPAYQRRSRWNNNKKSKLIESFLMNVPVPPIFLNEDKYGQYSVIDGKQRLIAISDFLRGRLVLEGLEIFSDINGMSFDDLPHPLQNVIKMRPTLRAIIILRQSDEDIKFEVFQRLNTGGVSLNPQEIRNSTYPGPLNDLILELSENNKFHQLLGVGKNKENSAIYKEMKDAEFVLRYFTFKDDWREFSGGIKRNMNRYMALNQKMSDNHLKEAKIDFLRTIEAVEAAFGNHAFRRWMPEKNQWRGQILAALFDAEMFACRGLPAEDLQPRQEEIVEKMKALFGDQRFRKSIDAATNAPNSFRERITIVKEMLDQTISR
ncbi:MAG TPA: DUF262 domain-containing protein [Methanothrix sp.]|nr:DUF262 domain-containing protein [Methanothrix sp.]HPJ83895.1 DUF262 domain-containing protein [Methanothrix sp.]